MDSFWSRLYKSWCLFLKKWKEGLFFKRWKTFILIILNPPTLIFLIVTFLFIYLSYQSDMTKSTLSLYIILITISSAVVGGIISKQWFDITEGTILITRGKLAVRGLKLLLRNINILNQRVQHFLSSDNDKENEPIFVKRIYEEIKQMCGVITEETVNSIENWTDILPEADVKSYIGAISDLRLELERQKKDLKTSNLKYNDIKDKSTEDKEKHEKEIREKQNEISNLEKNLTRQKIDFGFSGYSTDFSKSFSLSAIGESLAHDPLTLKIDSSYFQAPKGEED